jgi:hypothetical protein
MVLWYNEVNSTTVLSLNVKTRNNKTMDCEVFCDSAVGQLRPNPPSVAALMGYLETVMNRECDEDEDEEEDEPSEVNRELKKFFGFGNY